MERTPYPNGKDLITIEWKDFSGATNTLALYQSSYYNGNGLALLMWDITTDEPWGNITINLPGAYLDEDEVFIDDIVSDETCKALKGIITLTGEAVRYNYGRYRVAKVNKSILSKIPSEPEVMEMIYGDEDNGVPTL